MNAKQSMQGLRWLGLALGMAGAVCAQASEPQGLRLVSSQLTASAAGARVEARVSRTLGNSLLTPQQLRVALVAVDGSVRAEQRHVVGPAQLPRHGIRDAYLSFALGVAPAPDDRLEVEWLSGRP